MDQKRFAQPLYIKMDERDNVANVTPHAEFAGNALYEFLPALSRGTGEPSPTTRVELTTVDLRPGTASAFEVALAAQQPKLSGETLWYRMVAGGAAPRYVRLHPQPTLAAILEARNEQALPDSVSASITRMTVEILSLRPAMSYGLGTPARP